MTDLQSHKEKMRVEIDYVKAIFGIAFNGGARLKVRVDGLNGHPDPSGFIHLEALVDYQGKDISYHLRVAISQVEEHVVARVFKLATRGGPK